MNKSIERETKKKCNTISSEEFQSNRLKGSNDLKQQHIRVNRLFVWHVDQDGS